jgi:hypothetical protein
MAKNKAQHVVPRCYLEAWCDPATPQGQKSYIWRISKDGSASCRRSPEKSFTSTDRYTIKLPGGRRDLAVEDALSALERDFVRVRAKIRKQEPLDLKDRMHLCFFTAAMRSRSLRAGDQWKAAQQASHEQVLSMEHEYECEPFSSLQTAKMVEFAHQQFIMLSLEVEAPLLLQMKMNIIVSQESLAFITSDSPCAWVNRKAHTFPPAVRNPGLGQADTEVTLPLTPQHLLLLSHQEYPFYVQVDQKYVDEANRLRVACATKEFVSWKEETHPAWFKVNELPPDAWEFTEEGKKATQRQAKWDEMRAKWEANQRDRLE